jgi:tetratricopeptide (TPR) repeat protein
VLEQKRDSLHTAIAFYNKAIQVPNADPYQKTYPYETLGNIHFEAKDFVKAGLYYDSVVQISKKSIEKRIRRIRRKYKGLASLIKFETVLERNDSVLKIATWSESEQKVFFEKHIEKLKKEDERKAAQELKDLYAANSFGGGAAVKSKKKGKWYFYNFQSLTFGKLEFEKIWGNRALEDNWRISERQKVATDTIVVQKDKEKEVVVKYELKTYLDALPKNKTAIDSLKFDRNDALYQTGLIYKEQFKDLKLAAKRLERLLISNPDKRIILPVNFLLYQLYTELNDPKAIVFKNAILTNYADTKYAKIIMNVKVTLEKEKTTELEAIYKELYYLYAEKRYNEVVPQIDELKDRIEDSDLIARFELLRAISMGKYQSKENYKIALEYVSLNYANTLQGKRAKEIIKQLNN